VWLADRVEGQRVEGEDMCVWCACMQPRVVCKLCWQVVSLQLVVRHLSNAAWACCLYVCAAAGCCD
jgi:hypothetical protein